MVRAQIQLTEQQSRKLRAIAQRQGISFSEAVRRCIDRSFEAASSRVGAYDAARKLVGAFADKDGAGKLARNHDAFVEDAFG